jgi:hypothetical protein
MGGDNPSHSLLAQVCLRCFISAEIQEVCCYLEFRFGHNHGFNRHELFPYVLDDTLIERQGGNSSATPTDYTPMSLKILQTFNPDRANLSTWTGRMVMYEPELNAFLLSRGVYLVSDWAILNDTSSQQIQRILSGFHLLNAQTVTEARHLLESYHAVYRQDRLAQRRQGRCGRKCQPPSLEQLQRISALLGSGLSPETILARLQDLADHLRQYRIYVRGGCIREQSLDDPALAPLVEQQQLLNQDGEEESSEREFLQGYRQQIKLCLQEALAQVIAKWTGHQKAPKNQQWLKALELFHCQGYSMSAIAPLVGLRAQYQVTRLLKLKDFRADVQQQMLRDLRHRLLAMAASYTNPERLQQQEKQIAAILDEQVTTFMEAAASEASSARNLPLKSLFARTLCQYLHSLSDYEPPT